MLLRLPKSTKRYNYTNRPAEVGVEMFADLSANLALRCFITINLGEAFSNLLQIKKVFNLPHFLSMAEWDIEMYYLI